MGGRKNSDYLYVYRNKLLSGRFISLAPAQRIYEKVKVDLSSSKFLVHDAGKKHVFANGAISPRNIVLYLFLLKLGISPALF